MKTDLDSWLYFECINGMCSTLINLRLTAFAPDAVPVVLCPICTKPMHYGGFREADEYGFGSQADTQARFVMSENDVVASARERQHRLSDEKVPIHFYDLETRAVLCGAAKPEWTRNTTIVTCQKCCERLRRAP